MKQIKDYVDKVYLVYEQYMAKHLLNDCHFKLLNAKPSKEDPTKVVFRFEDTPELRKEVAKFNNR